MRMLHHVSWYGMVLSVCAFAVIGEVAWIYERQRTMKTSQRQVQRLRKELRDLKKEVPSLSVENAAELGAELSAIRAAADELKAQLKWAPEQPDTTVEVVGRAERADGFFEIASFVERMREQAQQFGVQLAPDERFGFATFAHSGPSLTERATVLRQRSVAEFVLQALFAAQPQQLNSVAREAAVAGNGSRREGRLAPSGSSDELMSPDVRWSLRRSGTVETCALRFSFTGQTVSLRLLLNRLVNADFPLAVRSVEIEPAANGQSLHGQPPSEPEPIPPLVARGSSQFTVTIEAYDFAEAIEARKG